MASIVKRVKTKNGSIVVSFSKAFAQAQATEQTYIQHPSNQSMLIGVLTEEERDQLLRKVYAEANADQTVNEKTTNRIIKKSTIEKPTKKP